MLYGEKDECVFQAKDSEGKVGDRVLEWKDQRKNKYTSTL